MKFVSRLILFLMAVFLLHPETSIAQKFTDKGTSEVAGTLAFIFQGTSASKQLDISNFIFTPYIGAMFAKGFEIGFSPSVHPNERAVIGLYIAPAYNFTTGSTVYPFIEGVAGYEIVSTGTSGDGTAYGFNVGTKSNLSGNFLLILQFGYLQQNYKMIEYIFDKYPTSVTTIAVSAGFSIFFP